MTLKLPETLRIGSVDYDVAYQRGLTSGDTLLGQINYGQCKIRIEESLPTSRAREVLAHELAHGILFEAGYLDHDEEQANRLGKVLAMLLRDNDFTFMRGGLIKCTSNA